MMVVVSWRSLTGGFNGGTDDLPALLSPGCLLFLPLTELWTGMQGGASGKGRRWLCSAALLPTGERAQHVGLPDFTITHQAACHLAPPNKVAYEIHRQPELPQVLQPRLSSLLLSLNDA